MSKLMKETFVRPVDDMKIKLDGLRDYDLVDLKTTENKVSGHMQKKFAMLAQKYFKEYFETIKRVYPNGSFVTYLEDENVLSGAVPQNLSVLIKEIRPNHIDMFSTYNSLYSEVLCPHIFNFFGEKTVFNSVACHDGRFFVLSIDFIKKNQRFFNAADLNEELMFLKRVPVEENLASLREKIDVLKQKIKIYYGDKQIVVDEKKLEEDFLFNYLMRVFLIADIDYAAKNYGFIYNILTGEVETAPAFDFEFGFMSVNYKSEESDAILKYIYDIYPNVINRFMAKVKAFINEKDGESVAKTMIYKYVPDKDNAGAIFEIVRMNAANLMESFEGFEKNVCQNQPQ